jgi:peptide-methionine (S)-S-oxide reductase
MKQRFDIWISIGLLLTGANAAMGQSKNMKTSEAEKTTNRVELATFGGGCFWCIEAVFERLDGVKSVTSGYAGGRTDNPTYEQVCSGTTSHAEVAQIEFDLGKISYEQLLAVFWEAHDPTTLNRQGPDSGSQYRSAIFYHSEAQKLAAEKSRKAAQAHFTAPIVTEIAPLTKFYKAENYHQDYFRNNPRAPYCAVVIRPKLEKLQKKIGVGQ